MNPASRKWLLAEGVLLLAPVTVLAALGTAWSARFLVTSLAAGNWQDPLTWMAVVIAAGLLGCLGGWWLLVRYLRTGQLRPGGNLAWIGAGIGLSAALAGAWLAVRGSGAIFAIGVVAIVPLIHLFWLKQAKE